jgi:hypothetical protein
MIMLATTNRPSATDDGISAAEQPAHFAEADMNPLTNIWGVTRTRACRRLLPNVDACRLPSYASSDAIMAAISEAILQA